MKKLCFVLHLSLLLLELCKIMSHISFNGHLSTIAKLSSHRRFYLNCFETLCGMFTSYMVHLTFNMLMYSCPKCLDPTRFEYT